MLSTFNDACNFCTRRLFGGNSIHYLRVLVWPANHQIYKYRTGYPDLFISNSENRKPGYQIIFNCHVQITACHALIKTFFDKSIS